jgi:tetratricopeptide (TPR) repeat protein
VDEAGAAFEKAVTLLEEAIERNPVPASAYRYLGAAALYKVASYEDAEKALRRSLDNKQNDVQLMLINVYTKQSRFPEALQQVTTYLAKNPKSPQRASLERIKEQLEKALKN